MIKYKLIERKNLSKDAEPDSTLYYPILVSNGKVSFDDLCNEIAEQGSLTSGDVKNCIDRLIYNAAQHLKEGRGVDTGDLGSFSIYVRSSGAATKEEYDPQKMMRTPKVRFFPGKLLREVQERVQYERVNSDEPTVEEDEEESDGPSIS